MISVEQNGWQNGLVLLCGRDEAESLLSREEIRRRGLYFLCSPGTVFMGVLPDFQSDLPFRFLSMPWWKKAVLITTKTDSLTDSDIEYLHSSLLGSFSRTNTLIGADDLPLFNKSVNQNRRAILDEFLDNALLVLKLVGIDLFSENITFGEKNAALSTGTPHRRTKAKTMALDNKRKTIEFLSAKGISFEGKYFSFASRQTNDNTFWNNARKAEISREWYLVLNNQITKEVFVLRFPPNEFQTSLETIPGKLKLRRDKPYYLDLNIDADSFVDRASRLDFTRYIIHRFKY